MWCFFSDEDFIEVSISEEEYIPDFGLLCENDLVRDIVIIILDDYCAKRTISVLVMVILNIEVVCKSLTNEQMIVERLWK